MNLAAFGNFWWLILLFLPFIFVQRWFHRELQQVILLLTGKRKAVLIFLALLFFPGVMLHEGSHYLAAKLMGVRTGRFSLIPSIGSEGNIRMGFVEAERVDFIRSTLIGAAPLVTGGIAIILIARFLLDFNPLFEPAAFDLHNFWSNLRNLFAVPRFWIGMLLAVSISSMMIPSASDRRDWLAFLLFGVIFFGLFYLTGALGWLQQFLLPWLDRVMQSLVLVFGVSLLVHILVLVPVWLIRITIAKLAWR